MTENADDVKPSISIPQKPEKSPMTEKADDVKRKTIVQRVTDAVRQADNDAMREWSTECWVRTGLLPALESVGLKIVPMTENADGVKPSKVKVFLDLEDLEDMEGGHRLRAGDVWLELAVEVDGVRVDPANVQYVVVDNAGALKKKAVRLRHRWGSLEMF